MENKPNHKNFVHLVGLYMYRRMLHGAYSVKSTSMEVEPERLRGAKNSIGKLHYLNVWYILKGKF